MRRTRWIVAMASLLFAGSIGCSTNYKPRPSPRIAVVIEDGAPALEKNGNVVKVGPFGGGLVESVEGVPAAEEHADTFRGRTIGGFVMSILGAPVAGAGAGLLVYNESQDPPSDGLRAASLGLIGGGLALAITGSIFMATAQPHFWDAINSYNDAVPAYGPPAPGMWVPGPPPGAPGAPPATPAPPAAPAPAPAPAPSAAPTPGPAW